MTSDRFRQSFKLFYCLLKLSFFPQHVTIPQALAQREYPYGTIGAKVFFFFCDADEDELGALSRPRKRFGKKTFFRHSQYVYTYRCIDDYLDLSWYYIDT